MATTDEIRKLSSEVNRLSETILQVADESSRDQVHFKKFLQAERKELSTSIEAAADKIDKSSKASFWLSAAIAFFAFVEAISIAYDAFFKTS